MRRLFSCFGKLKGRRETGAQAVEQATKSNPSDGKFTYEEICDMMPTPWFDFFVDLNYWDGEVFLGSHHYQRVAIKSIHDQGHESEEFEAAILALRKANHPNLLKVLGHCIEGQRRFVVYEYSNLPSMDTHLFDEEREPLDWDTRMKIALGCAKGLEYLHNTMDPPVIHRNIRSKNVYLDDEFVPKLFDFGLPKRPPRNWQIDFLGWKAPEFIDTAHSNLLTDIYSFGVLLLVIITGRKAYDTKEQLIADWARSMWKTTKMDMREIVDPRIKLQCPLDCVFKCFEIAMSCINLNPSIRPDISEVRRELERIASRLYVHTVGGSRALPQGRTFISPAEERAASSFSPA